MPKYMLIAGGADVNKRSGNNPQLAPLVLERYMTWIQGLRDSGRFMGSYKLHDQTGRRLTIRAGDVIDGPFIESKDAIGGIFIIDAASLDEAAEIARSCPCLDPQNGYMEVRLIEVARRYPSALAAYADLHASLGNLDEARAYVDRALANQSSPGQHALLKRKGAALDETPAVAVFGSDRPCGTAELRARLEGYWTRTLDSLKARLENAPMERDSD
jgi:hypothetical protein